jgi:predicted DNA-binding protein with PD1-like motif
MRTLMLLTLLAAAATAQQTRKEITNPGPHDAAGLDAKVPDVYAIPAQFDSVLICRFKNQTDLLDGLQRTIKQHHVQNAVIISAFGSVTGYSIHQVSNRTFPSKDTITTDPTMPADIVTMSGFVMNGRLHPHISLATPDKAFGGHLEPGTKVFTFAVVTMGVLKGDQDLQKLDDKNYR